MLGGELCWRLDIQPSTMDLDGCTGQQGVDGLAIALIVYCSHPQRAVSRPGCAEIALATGGGRE